jgi:hypothetical protein
MKVNNVSKRILNEKILDSSEESETPKPTDPEHPFPPTKGIKDPEVEKLK